MRYNLASNIEVNKALAKLNYCIENERVIELKEVRRRRTIKQNSYIHVLFTLFGIEYGYTLEESKTLLKRLCPFMVYVKNGEKFLRSTRDMNTKELTDFIDWVREYAGQNGLYLPTPEEYLINQNEINRDIEINKKFM